MHVTLGLLLALGSQHPSPASEITPRSDAPRRQQTAARISVWADREQPYKRGDDVRISFRSEASGHVTIMRVDTDGRIHVLFPREPWRRTFVRGGQTLEVADSRDQASFRIEDAPGIGYLFAVTSPLPFEYDEVTRGDYWDFRSLEEGRIRGDPYVALTDLARRITPRGNFGYDIAPYYVERRYAYPRFVCNECHSYARPNQWDPYAQSCGRYRVVIYDDPAYYPYRYNGGRNVVPARPLRPAARYVFRDAEPGVEYLTRLRQRESHERRRREGDRGRTSVDVGGRGAVPAPGLTAEPRTTRGAEEHGPVLRRELAKPEERAPADERRAQRRREKERKDSPPEGLRPADREPRKVPPVQRGARDPQSTGEPQLRRRKP
jgi:hypothetical protein